MIEEMKKELTEWMDDKGYDSIAQFKGKMMPQPQATSTRSNVHSS